MDDPIAHLAILNGAVAPRSPSNLLAIGSDVEIAGLVNRDLIRVYGELVHSEGHFWRYCGTHWQAMPAHELRLAVHKYDGAYFSTPGGGASRVKLSKARIDSVLNELAALVAEPSFFATRLSASIALPGLSVLQRTERRTWNRTLGIIFAGTGCLAVGR